MRRTIAAVVTAVVVGVTAIGGPVATTPAGAQADPVGEFDRIACGTLGEPVCGLIDQLEVLLQPLEPVLALGSPLLGDLGVALQSLTALTEQLPDTTVPDMLAAVRTALAQVGKVSQPVLGLLGLGSLDGLGSTLQQLEAALVDQLSGASAGGSADAPAPAVAAATTAASVGLSSSALSNGGSLSSGAPASPASPTVPVGRPLDLGPLMVPEFSSSTTDLGSARSITESALPVVDTATGPSTSSDSGKAMALAMAISGLMLVVGLGLRKLHPDVLPAVLRSAT